jgi:hypothetical protein
VHTAVEARVRLLDGEQRDRVVSKHAPRPRSLILVHRSVRSGDQVDVILTCTRTSCPGHSHVKGVVCAVHGDAGGEGEERCGGGGGAEEALEEGQACACESHGLDGDHWGELALVADLGYRQK